MSSLTQSPAWLALQAHQPVMLQQHLRALFQNDPQRFEKFSLSFNDILIDFSKQPITCETVELLLVLAHQHGGQIVGEPAIRTHRNPPKRRWLIINYVIATADQRA